MKPSQGPPSDSSITSSSSAESVPDSIRIDIRTPWHLYPTDVVRIAGARYAGSGTEKDPFIVDWLPGNDAENPMTWPGYYKWLLTALVAIATLAIGFCSSAYAGAAGYILVDFNTSQELVTLGISMFVLGFALGPLLWAPLSEVLGRRPLFIYTFIALVAFNVGVALAPNITALIVLRFFAGAFGSSPMTNAGGTIADMFSANQRGLAMSLFATAPFMGPVIGPIAGGFAGEFIGWRWVMWIIALFSAGVLLLGALLLPETYHPVLLRSRAKRLSKATGRVYRSKFDQQGGVKLSALLKTSLTRPWALLFREPIVFLLAIYMAIIYGILYMCFAAFPIVFQAERGWSPGVGGLAFVGVAIGMAFAVLYTVIDNRRYVRVAAAHGSFAPPEARLPGAMVGAVAIPAGLFWFAFTNAPGTHWAVSIAATVPFGFGLVLVFLSCMNYLIDSYLIYAASVLAAATVIRSALGAVFPLFTPHMYDALGIHWASALAAFLALACLPFPFLFWR